MGVRGRAGAVKRGAVYGAALVACLWSLPVAAEEVDASTRVDVTVMSQNLYLGSSLDGALVADTVPAFVEAVAEIYGNMLVTNFPVRAAEIADMIAAEEPELIGLQEVSRWVATPTQAGPTPLSFDFLEILDDELDDRGLDYEVAAVSDNAHIGPVPLVFPLAPIGCDPPPVSDPGAFECVVELLDRDVILVNADTPNLDWSNPQSGRFEAQATVEVPTGDELSFDRGWAAIDVTFEGRFFRFVNTHLEVEIEDSTAVQQAQAAELLAGPMRPGRALIAVGDFNAAPDGSTAATYAELTSRWLDDLVPSSNPNDTCCQDELLNNRDSKLSQRIDLVLTHGSAHGVEAHVDIGAIDRALPPFWASDHAAVVATVQV